jgi:hypothetical protein
VCVFGLSLGLEQGMKLVSALETGAFDAFDYAFGKGQAPTDLAGLKGKTIVLGGAGWQAICDPMFASKRIDLSSIMYVEVANLIGRNFLKLPTNTFVMRRADPRMRRKKPSTPSTSTAGRWVSSSGISTSVP